MRTFLKVVAVSSALLVAAQAVPAAAGDRHGDDMLAAGVAGLAAGVIAGAIVSGSNDGPREVQTYEEVPQYRQRPVYYSGGDYGYRPVRQNRIQPGRATGTSSAKTVTTASIRRQAPISTVTATSVSARSADPVNLMTSFTRRPRGLR